MSVNNRDSVALNNEYTSKKAAFQFSALHELLQGRQPNPTHVLIVLSDLCSHDCVFCLFRASGYDTSKYFGEIKPNGNVQKNPNRMIPFHKVIEIIDDCKIMGVKAIEFTGGGEPTLHPQFDAIVRHALESGMEVSLVTHGAALKNRVDLVAKMEWIRISLDAGSPEMYAKIHRVNGRQFDQVLENIRSLAEAKRRLETNVTIGVSFVMTDDNWYELLNAVAMCRDVGADTFRISAEFIPDEHLFARGRLESGRLLAEQAEELQTDTFRIHNHWSKKTNVSEIGQPDYSTCWYQQFTTFIGGDQNVYRCCRTSYQERGLIGSIANQSFRDLWESDHKQQRFAQFDARGCRDCHVNDRNREVELLMHPPRHVNFV
jgi:molybdenum cofactor biosynthesis enzyme MoaA